MLILGMNLGDYVVIDDNIIVKMVKIKGELKLAIEAPKEVRIERGDVYERNNARPAKLMEQRK